MDSTPAIDTGAATKGVERITEGAMEFFRRGAVVDAMLHTTKELDELRRGLPDAVWRGLTADPHLTRLRSTLHEEPYTARGFAKPRGYPGDAVLLDLIYGTAPLPDSVSRQGREMYVWCHTNSTAFQSVRLRRDRLAAAIDDAAERNPGARVLAVACGHLREGAVCQSLGKGTVGEIVALDQDPLSLNVVAATYPQGSVTPVCAGVGDLIKRRAEVGTFDLVYAAGLYDYLDDRAARALTSALCALLDPGGELVLANFTDIWERGYIEAAMEWFLIYRTADELASLVPTAEMTAPRTATDEHGAISYAYATRI